MEQSHWVPAFPPQPRRHSQEQEVVDLTMLWAGEKDGWDTETMLIPTKETKAPDDSLGRKGECEGNEMENTGKLETWPRGGGKELEGSGAGRCVPEGLVQRGPELLSF